MQCLDMGMIFGLGQDTRNNSPRLRNAPWLRESQSFGRTELFQIDRSFHGPSYSALSQAEPFASIDKGALDYEMPRLGIRALVEADFAQPG
jgi:hypothetical protein